MIAVCNLDTIGKLKTLPEVRREIARAEKEIEATEKDDSRRAELKTELEALRKKQGELEDPQ
ncbi:MAG: hypothetical protein Q8N16_01545 [bacterium]|nr:hypothetical protein [bacterium]